MELLVAAAGRMLDVRIVVYDVFLGLSHHLRQLLLGNHLGPRPFLKPPFKVNSRCAIIRASLEVDTPHGKLDKLLVFLHPVGAPVRVDQLVCSLEVVLVLSAHLVDEIGQL